jgi:hypothetical protein
MDSVDNRGDIFELEEIFKYKDLIELEDKDIIKTIICNPSKESNSLHKEFLRLVTQEVDHKLTKEEFKVLKNKLIREMRAYING